MDHAESTAATAPVDTDAGVVDVAARLVVVATVPVAVDSTVQVDDARTMTPGTRKIAATVSYSHPLSVRNKFTVNDVNESRSQ